MTYRSQAVASSVFGTALSFALCALYAQFGPGEPATNFVIALFLLVPLWSAIMVWGLKREDPRTAWIGLAAALGIASAVLIVARETLGG